MNNQTEIFKDIKGFEGKYQISNFLNVKSLNFRRTGIEGILKPSINSKGDKYVALYKDKRIFYFIIEKGINLNIPNSTSKNIENIINMATWKNIQFNSSNLDSAAYNPDTKELIIKFLNGNFYSYSNVPQNDVDNFYLVSTYSSAGKYFHKNIRNKFNYKKL
jgi:hypothetical protein